MEEYRDTEPVCIVCGKTHARESRFCSVACEKKHNQAKLKLKRMEEGLCPKCGSPMDFPMRVGGPGAATGKQKISYCSKCREDYRRRYEEKKAKKAEKEGKPAQDRPAKKVLPPAVPSVATKKVMWFSRHKMLPSQEAELKLLFGGTVNIISDPQPFSTADDVIQRFLGQKADDLVIVAPLSVIGAICDREIHPLYAQMEEVSSVQEAEVGAKGRWYRFVQYRRVKRLVLEFEEIEKPGE